MLAGGALVDRTSPRLVILATNALRMILVMSLAYMIYNDAVQVTTVFILAFAFGVADAFSTLRVPQSSQALFLGMTFKPVTRFFRPLFTWV